MKGKKEEVGSKEVGSKEKGDPPSAKRHSIHLRASTNLSGGNLKFEIGNFRRSRDVSSLRQGALNSVSTEPENPCIGEEG